MKQFVSVKPLPFFYVGAQATSSRISRFSSNKHNLLSQALGKPDTKSIWYTKEHFEKLLEEINFAGGDGIKISLGMYEEGHQFAGQLCLLFNVTREKVENNIVSHADVILENEPDYPERASLPREIVVFPGTDPGEVRDFNLGYPCPPRCPGQDDIS